jgi:hypothetical protein
MVYICLLILLPCAKSALYADFSAFRARDPGRINIAANFVIVARSADIDGTSPRHIIAIECRGSLKSSFEARRLVRKNVVGSGAADVYAEWGNNISDLRS